MLMTIETVAGPLHANLGCLAVAHRAAPICQRRRLETALRQVHHSDPATVKVFCPLLRPHAVPGGLNVAIRLAPIRRETRPTGALDRGIERRHRGSVPTKVQTTVPAGRFARSPDTTGGGLFACSTETNPRS